MSSSGTNFRFSSKISVDQNAMKPLKFRTGPAASLERCRLYLDVQPIEISVAVENGTLHSPSRTPSQLEPWSPHVAFVESPLAAPRSRHPDGRELLRRSLRLIALPGSWEGFPRK